MGALDAGHDTLRVLLLHLLTHVLSEIHDYQDAVTKIVLAGKRAGKPLGIGGIGGRLDLLEKWFAMGATWSLSGGDAAIL